MSATDLLAMGKALMGDVWEESELFVKLTRRVPGARLTLSPAETRDNTDP